MKTCITGELVRRTVDEDNSMEVTFRVDNWRYRNWLSSLDKKNYSIVLSDIRSKRSLQQNKYLWALIHEISKNENSQSNDDWEMYCYLLRLAKAKYTYITVLEEALEDLKKEVRALLVVGYETRRNGSKWAKCQVFIGSSKMNKEEMRRLIDTTLEYAENLGIDTFYYRDMMGVIQ